MKRFKATTSFSAINFSMGEGTDADLDEADPTVQRLIELNYIQEIQDQPTLFTQPKPRGKKAE